MIPTNRTNPQTPQGNRRRCGKCGSKLYEVRETTTDVMVTCHGCQNVMFGFKKTPPPEATAAADSAASLAPKEAPQ